MKSLLFAAFALSLILVVSAQCDPDAILNCTQDYARMVSKLDLQLYYVCVRLLYCSNYLHCLYHIQYFTVIYGYYYDFCHGVTV